MLFFASRSMIPTLSGCVLGTSIWTVRHGCYLLTLLSRAHRPLAPDLAIPHRNSHHALCFSMLLHAISVPQHRDSSPRNCTAYETTAFCLYPMWYLHLIRKFSQTIDDLKPRINWFMDLTSSPSRHMRTCIQPICCSLPTICLCCRDTENLSFICGIIQGFFMPDKPRCHLHCAVHHNLIKLPVPIFDRADTGEDCP
jgi:hypothetical protein